MATRILMLCCAVLIGCSGVQVRPLSWSNLDRLERQLTDWAERQGEERLLQLGRSADPGEEYEAISLLFPYLLPESTRGYHIYMTCAPDFVRYWQHRSVANYQTWSQCVRFDYMDRIPQLLAEALHNLSPEEP